MERYSRSFFDALSLDRDKKDQATIYYCKDRTRAVYEVSVEGAYDSPKGYLFVNGKRVTMAEVPSSIPLPKGAQLGDFVVVLSAEAARAIFKHVGVDIHTGWDLRP